MVKRIPKQFVAICLVTLLCWKMPAQADTTLVSYNFDYDILDSGPDTYQIFQINNQKAIISEDYASAGYASAHLIDEANDNDFVEFQGYFPEQKSGVVHTSFKLLIAGESNLFNMALVGRDRYQLSPLGINFWLIYEAGWLRHKSDSIPKKLFQPHLYEWYKIDVALDIEKGVYNLRITDEVGNVIINLDNQPVAAGVEGAHSLSEFSFIGDFADNQPANFYIDDLIITTSNDVELPPMVAPGRRKFFFEQWDDYHKQLQSNLKCLPAKDMDDFGFHVENYQMLARKNKLNSFYQLLRSSDPLLSKPDDWKQSKELSAVAYWLMACQALEDDKSEKAKKYIEMALDNNPNAYMYQLTDLIIEAALKQNNEGLYSKAYALMKSHNDVRTQIALAMIAFKQNQFDVVEETTQSTANHALQELGQIKMPSKLTDQQRLLLATDYSYAQRLTLYMPNQWEHYLRSMLVLEQRYYAYLWQGNYHQAGVLAGDVAHRLQALQLPPGIWQERQADSAFLANDLDKALVLYGAQNVLSHSSALKMADIYYLRGDLANEKLLREDIFKSFIRNTKSINQQ